MLLTLTPLVALAVATSSFVHPSNNNHVRGGQHRHIRPGVLLRGDASRRTVRVGAKAPTSGGDSGAEPSPRDLRPKSGRGSSPRGRGRGGRRGKARGRGRGGGGSAGPSAVEARRWRLFNVDLPLERDQGKDDINVSPPLVRAVARSLAKQIGRYLRVPACHKHRLDAKHTRFSATAAAVAAASAAATTNACVTDHRQR